MGVVQKVLVHMAVSRRKNFGQPPYRLDDFRCRNVLSFDDVSHVFSPFRCCMYILRYGHYVCEHHVT